MIKHSKNETEQEYRHLKNKVEDQIKLLQQKLSKNSQIHYHRSLSSIKNLQIPSSKSQYHIKNNNTINERGICQHTCRHINHKNNHICKHTHNNNSNHCCSRNDSFQNQENSQNILINGNILSAQNSRNQQIQRNQQSISQNIIYQNKILQEAYLKSIQNQKQLSQNLKVLTQKLQKLQNNSRVKANSQLSSQNHFRFKSSMSKQNDSSYGERSRAKSLARQQLNPVLKQYSKRRNIQRDSSKGSGTKSKNQKKLSKSNEKSSRQYLFNVRSQKNLKVPNLTGLKSKKNKNNQNWRTEYFGDQKICPIHTSPKISLVRIRQKEVYQDTFHRNRKHQRDHLIESFKQQQIARKKLMSKILQFQGLQLKQK